MTHFHAQIAKETLRARLNDAVLRRQAGLPPLQDHGDLLEGALEVVERLEQEVADLEEELGDG